VQKANSEVRDMNFKAIYGLFLVFPLAAYSACSSSDDTSASGGSGNFGGTAGSRGGAGGKGGTGGAAGRGGTGGASTGGSGVGGSAVGGSDAGGSSTGGSNVGGSSAGVSGSEAGAAGEGTGGTADMVQLSDNQIIKILVDANTGEISAAEIAKPRLKVAAAISFAEMMITDHGNAQQQVLALASTKQLAPEKSTVSDQLDAEAAALLAKLSATPSNMLDSVYMQSQVKMHQEVLALIDTELMPSASDADLKALLTTLRAAVAAHLAQAQTIVAAL
jgi:predicted outer membrane protein